VTNKTGDCVQSFKIKTSAKFIDKFPEIFTNDVKAAILKSPDEHLFSRTEGVMIGDGQVWMNPTIGQDIKIGQIDRALKSTP
jgi:hypothetical protein